MLIRLKNYKYYFVSDDGIVWTRYMDGRTRPLSPRINNSGYARVVIGKKEHLVHRLVAEAFIPNPDNLETVNHRDLNKLNNTVGNLEWLSRGDNIRHCKKSYLTKMP